MFFFLAWIVFCMGRNVDLLDCFADFVGARSRMVGWMCGAEDGYICKKEKGRKDGMGWEGWNEMECCIYPLILV